MGEQLPFDNNNFIPIDDTDLYREMYAIQNQIHLPKINQEQLLKNRLVAEMISAEVVEEYRNDEPESVDFVTIFIHHVVDFAYIISDKMADKWTVDILLQAMGLTLDRLVMKKSYTELFMTLLESIMQKLVVHNLNTNLTVSDEAKPQLEDTILQYLQKAAKEYGGYEEDLSTEDDEELDDEVESNLNLADLKAKYFFEVLNASGVLDLYQQHHSIRPVIKKHIAFLGDHPELLALTILYAPAMRDWLEMQVELGDWSDMDYTISDFFSGVNSMFLQDVIASDHHSEMIYYTNELKALINGMLVTTPPELMAQSSIVLTTGSEMSTILKRYIENLDNQDQLTTEGLNLAQDIIYNIVAELFNKTFITFDKWTVPMISTVIIHQFHTFDTVGVDGFEFVDEIVIDFARWLHQQNLISASQVNDWEKAVEFAQLPRYRYALLADAQDYLKNYQINTMVRPIS